MSLPLQTNMKSLIQHKIISSPLKQAQSSLLVLAFLSLFPFTGQQALAVTILTPEPTGKLMIQSRRATTSLIIKVNEQELANLRVAKEGNRNSEAKSIDPMGQWKNNGSIFMHYTLPLKKGTNTFIIYPEERELKIRFRPIRTLLNVNFEDPAAYLFHRNAVVPKACSTCHTEKLPEDAGLDIKRLQKNEDFSPICFSCHRQLISSSMWLHSPSANVYCMSCHQEGQGNTQITVISGRVDQICFECHVNKKKFKDQAHVHGPVGTGDCTVCHDPHGGKFKYQLWADNRSGICIGCHIDKKDLVKKRKGFYSHGILQGGGCKACHDPHASKERYQLINPINELCSNCHTKLFDVEKGHPVGNHPLKDKADPRRKGRKLSCSSCHNPHGSFFRYLLIGDMLGGHVCSKCHH
jgi:predicted CXXCH cytochrome family protein